MSVHYNYCYLASRKGNQKEYEHAAGLLVTHIKVLQAKKVRVSYLCYKHARQLHNYT